MQRGDFIPFTSKLHDYPISILHGEYRISVRLVDVPFLADGYYLELRIFGRESQKCMTIQNVPVLSTSSLMLDSWQKFHAVRIHLNREA